MNVERLIRMAELLEADAANPTGVKFTLDTWAQDARMENQSLAYEDRLKFNYPMNVETIPVDCNTAACAMGLAAISGAFKNDGLSWRILNTHEYSGTLLPKFGQAEGFEAAVLLFGIGPITADQLFDPNHYVETKGAEAELEVASRIRGLVAGTWQPTIDDDDYDCDDCDD